jgi:hypothetical protein
MHIRRSVTWFLKFSRLLIGLSINHVDFEFPECRVTFTRLQTLEIHWCSENALQGAKFPSLVQYLRSADLTRGERPPDGVDSLALVLDCILQIDTILLRGKFQKSSDQEDHS